MSINSKGIWKTDRKKTPGLVNNFAESGNLNGWTAGGTLTNNVLVLTGTSPAFTSTSFTVNPDDILVVEFSLAFTTLSTGSGVYIGSLAGANTRRYYYDSTTMKWGNPADNTDIPWATYWLSNYNSTTRKTIKSYLIGSNVDVNRVPAPEGTTVLIQLTSGTTSNIRHGYNANTGMTFEIYYCKVYNLDQYGLIENDNIVEVGKGYVHTNDFIEY